MATTPIMNMTLPDPSSTLGPEWATLINAALTDVLDSHDHSIGKGARITPAAFNVNEDLTMNNWSLTSLKQILMTNNTSDPTGSNLRVIYPLNGELYYKDGAGNQVQITNSGSVAGATGNIGGIVGSAAITYTSIGVNRFVFTDEAGVNASIEVEDVDCDAISATGSATIVGNISCNLVSGKGTIPVGAIIPIASHLAGSVTIPSSGTVNSDGFMLCDGAAIPGGQTLSGNTPNLTDDRFLMGYTSAGVTGGSTSHTHGVDHVHASIRVDMTSSSLNIFGKTNIVTSSTTILGAGAELFTNTNLFTPSGSSTTYLRKSSTLPAGTNAYDYYTSGAITSVGASRTSTDSSDGRPKYLTVQYLIRVI